MRVAVTGSSGLIGQALLPALRAGGHETIALVRRTPGPGEAQWDPAAGILDPSALQGVGAAINLAGANIATRWTEKAKREIAESRVRGTKMLAENLARRSGGEGSPVLISISAVGYYGDRGDDVLTEASGPGSGFLSGVVQAWEAAADPARSAGIRVVHPRLGVVLSRKGGALAKMLLPFKLGLGGKVGSGEQWMSWVSIDDVVTGLIHLLNSTLQGPVNLAAPIPVQNADFSRTLGRILSRPAIIPVPPAALYLLFGQEMTRETLLWSTRVSSATLQRSGFKFRHPELQVALAEVI
jgi:uncharacterized protein